jgi:hypothetical protein
MIVEACLPWTPIPEQFGGAWQVDVVHFEEAATAESRRRSAPVSVAIAAYSEPTAERPREDGAWRLDFAHCYAFRRRIIHYTGSAPLTRPDADSAFWEIAPSQFMVDSGVQGAHAHFSSLFHHYVIVAGIHEVYEFVATGWTVEALPDEWAQPFGSKPFPGW